MIGPVAVAFGLQAMSLLMSVSALVLACLAHRRSTAVQPLNLRVLLARDINTLRDHVANLNRLLDRAQNLCKKGSGINFTMELWDAEGEADRSIVETLVAHLPGHDERFFRLSEAELEAKLVEMHGISVEVSRLNAKYRNALPGAGRRRGKMG
jgi:hypothetical protein